MYALDADASCRRWLRVWREAKATPGFDVVDRVVCVDLEKGSAAAFGETMEHGVLYYDPPHVEKNMLLAVSGPEKKVCVALYQKALHAPTIAR
jgi:hypothetical protein